MLLKYRSSPNSGIRIPAVLLLNFILVSTIFCDEFTNFSFYDNFDSDIKFDTRWSLQQINSNPNKVKAEAPVSDPDAIDGKVLELVLPANIREAGPVGGPNIESTEKCSYGTYTARLKTPDCKPEEGIITGFFTYFNDYWNNPSNPVDENNNKISDNSEIDFEFVGAEKDCIYMSVWTDYVENPLNFKKITRRVNMRTGEIKQTPKGKENIYDLVLNKKRLRYTIPDFDHSAGFYEYGFIWTPENVKFYLKTRERIIELWNFSNLGGVPQHKAQFMFNLWHNDTHWHNGMKVLAPSANSILEIDFAGYKAMKIRSIPK